MKFMIDRKKIIELLFLGKVDFENDFHEKINQFSKSDNPTEILNYLVNHRDRISLEKKDQKNLIKINDEYHAFVGGPGRINLKTKTAIMINYYSKINLKKYEKLAVRNLRTTLLNEDLSLGDKKIIKDIAIKYLYFGLELAHDSPELAEHPLWTTNLDLNEAAKYELISYGFKYQHPSKEIKDIKL
jgi:hypothetical protein